MTQLKVLFLSIGSLVGTTFIELLMHPEYSRRKQVHLIGLNCLAETPNNFMCDQFYLTPRVEEKQRFISFLLNCIEKEQPDLILGGRDEDNLILAELREKYTELKAKIPLGTLRSAFAAVNKFETYQFCRQYELPVPKTLSVDHALSADQCMSFAEQVGYPLIAKPVRGFASKGVYIVRNAIDLEALLKQKGLLLQQFIGEKTELQAYLDSFAFVPPLFLGLENSFHFTAQSVISPKGDYAPIFVSCNRHQMGRSIWVEPVKMPEVEALSKKVIQAFIHMGGAGNLGIQWRADRNGAWFIQELNLRFNANSLIRLESGLDEMGLICDYFLNQDAFPNFTRKHYVYDKLYMKQVFSRAISKPDLKKLNQQGSLP